MSTPNNDSLNADNPSEGLSAYDSMNRGSSTSTESSLGEEGQTTSRVNRAATDDTGSDADETRESGGTRSEAGNSSELDYDRDTREDAGNGAGSDAGRPPLRNGDTGYAG